MKKKYSKNYLLYGAALAVGLLSFHTHARELPGDWPAGLQLGMAYDSTRHQEIMAACVEGPKVSIHKSAGDIKYANEASFEKIAKAFGGAVAVDLKVPFVKASASMDYARENASTDKRMNWFFEFNATRQSESFDALNLRLSRYGDDAFKAGFAAVPDWCGDEYVSKVDYGANLVGTMSIEFASREDKDEFKLAAALDVNMVVGSAKASARMAQMQQKMGSRTIVKVEAHQTGGNPGRLNGILGTGQVVRCTLSDMDNCLSTFENILRYANGDYKKQLDDVSGYSVIRYHTRSYGDSAARKLVPPTGFPILLKTVKVRREQIQNDYERELVAYTRANYIKSRLEHLVPANQMAAVEDILKKALANMIELTDAMKTCLSHPDQRCLSHQTNLVSYDRKDLEIEFTEQVDPHSDLGKLFKAVEKNDPKSAYHDAIKLGGPELMSKCDPQGYSPCHRAIEAGRHEMLSLFIQRDPHKGHATKSVAHLPCDDELEYTPMCLAAKGGTNNHAMCMDLLCHAGAGVDCTTKHGLTPLQVAVMHGKLETAQELIRRGANRGIKDKHDRNLLHLAAEGGDVSTIQYLINDIKIGVASKDSKGRTPLQWAARGGHIEAVDTLLGYGADPQARDHEGRTALHWGVEHEDVTKELLRFHEEQPMESREICGHDQPVIALAFSPDGRTLASSFENGDSVRLWDAKTGALVRTLTGHKRMVNKVAFSPDGRILASGSVDETVKLWNAENGALIRTLTGHEKEVVEVTFSPDGRVLASGSDDKTIRLWNVETGMLVRTLKGHGERVLAVTFSPDGSMLASGSDDKSVKLWKADTGALLHTITGHTEELEWGLAFSPDGRTMATASGGGAIKLWGVGNWSLYRTLIGHDTMVWKIAFSPNGSMLASASEDGTVKLWAADTGWLIQTLTGYGAMRFGLAFSPDGQTIAIGGEPGSINLLKLRWDSLLHHAVRGGNLNVVRMVAKSFPYLLHIRTPEGRSPLELAAELQASQGGVGLPELAKIIAFLKNPV